MCDVVRHRASCVFCVLLLVIVATARAQDPNAARKAYLRERVDSLASAHLVSIAAADRRDSADVRRIFAQGAASVDSVTVGPFRMVKPKGRGERVIRAFDRAWRDREDWMTAAEPLLRGVVFLIADDAWVEIYRELGKRPRHYGVARVTWETGTVERVVSEKIAGALTEPLPAEVRTWLRGGKIGGPDWLDRVYRQLAMSGSSAARDCYRGLAERCIDALGLSDPGPDWSRWYTIDDLRMLAQPKGQNRERFLVHPCFAEHNDRACLDLYAQKNPPGPSPPLSGAARASFVNYLLRHGKRDGILVLADSAVRPIEERLTDMAGGDVVRALAEWRKTVEAGRPQPVAASVATRLSTLFWVLVFAVLAMRSTRWRLT